MHTDPEAWRAEPTPAPTWCRWTEHPGIDAVDAGGVRALLTAAGLPEAELLHMGCPPWLLEPRPVRGGFVPARVAARLLGRIAWDSEHGARGRKWRGSAEQASWAKRVGAAIIDERFHA